MVRSSPASLFAVLSSTSGRLKSSFESESSFSGRLRSSPASLSATMPFDSPMSSRLASSKLGSSIMESSIFGSSMPRLLIVISEFVSWSVSSAASISDFSAGFRCARLTCFSLLEPVSLSRISAESSLFSSIPIESWRFGSPFVCGFRFGTVIVSMYSSSDVVPSSFISKLYKSTWTSS